MTAVEWLLQQMDLETISKYDKQLVKAKEMEKQQIIDFGVWYSGMEQEKVKKAFERFKKETK
jgi:hypothetical protein